MRRVNRIGVLTGGGEAPGLNAVIRAVVKAAANQEIEIVGLEDSFDVLIDSGKWRILTPSDVTGILRIGGTILGGSVAARRARSIAPWPPGLVESPFNVYCAVNPAVWWPIIRPTSFLFRWRKWSADASASRSTTTYG